MNPPRYLRMGMGKEELDVEPTDPKNSGARSNTSSHKNTVFPIFVLSLSGSGEIGLHEFGLDGVKIRRSESRVEDQHP